MGAISSQVSLVPLAQDLLIRSATMLDADLKRIEDLVSLQQTVAARRKTGLGYFVESPKISNVEIPCTRSIHEEDNQDTESWSRSALYGSAESSCQIDLGESVKLPNRSVFELCRSGRNGNRSATMPWSRFVVSCCLDNA